MIAGRSPVSKTGYRKVRGSIPPSSANTPISSSEYSVNVTRCRGWSCLTLYRMGWVEAGEQSVFMGRPSKGPRGCATK
jgi:hypothetical protein